MEMLHYFMLHNEKTDYNNLPATPSKTAGGLMFDGKPYAIKTALV